MERCFLQNRNFAGRNLSKGKGEISERSIEDEFRVPVGAITSFSGLDEATNYISKSSRNSPPPPPPTKKRSFEGSKTFSKGSKFHRLRPTRFPGVWDGMSLVDDDKAIVDKYWESTRKIIFTYLQDLNAKDESKFYFFVIDDFIYVRTIPKSRSRRRCFIHHHHRNRFTVYVRPEAK